MKTIPKRCIGAILIMISTLLVSETVLADSPADPDTILFNGNKYQIAFYDDFTYLDKDKWAYCPEQKRQDAGGEWRDSCSVVEDGKLVITCDVAEDGTPVSGGIRSTGEYEQTYGLYHIRFMLEKADGLWYAFWLLTDQMIDSSVGNGATDGAELDIMELVPHIGQYGMSVHWDGYGENLKSCFEYKDINDSFYDRYHDLWYLWNEDGYRLYMDGLDEDSLVFNFPGEEYGDGTCAVPCDLIISAEFGTWGGEIDRAQLPAHLYVDSVQIYKEAPDKTISVGEKAKFTVRKKAARVEVSDPSIATAKARKKKVTVTGMSSGTVTVMAYNKKGNVLGSWVVKVE